MSEFEGELQLLPRSLGISSPQGKDVYEFFLAVKFDPSILGKISNIFGQNKAEILGAHLQLSDDKKRAHAIFYIEMAKATIDVALLVEAFNQDSAVIEATAASRNKIFFEANMFPPTSGGHYRVFIMGSESWVNLVKSFKQKFGSSADSILYSQGVSAGVEMAEGIISRIGSGEDAVPKLANLKSLFKATGLGLLDISGNADSFQLAISESMGARSDVIDNFLVGVVAGTVGRLFSREYVVNDLKHNKKRGGLITFNLNAKRVV